MKNGHQVLFIAYNSALMVEGESQVHKKRSQIKIVCQNRIIHKITEDKADNPAIGAEQCMMDVIWILIS